MLKKIIIGFSLVIILASIVGAITVFVQNAVESTSSIGSTSFTVPTPAQNTFKNYSFFAATTTTATSTNLTGGGGYLVTAGAKKVDFYFSRGDTTGAGNSGSSIFTVQVTPDGTNWYAFNKLVQNVASTTSQTTVGSITITAATSTSIVSLDLQYDTFYAARCIVNETTDGEHTCSSSVEY